MEMLDISIEEEKRWQEYNEGKRLGLTVEQPGKNPLLLGNKPQDFTWRSLLKIRRSEIDLVLAIIPYNYAIYLLKTLVQLIKSGTQVEYAAKIALVLAQIHQTAIQMDVDVYNMINELSALLKQKLEAERDSIGFNVSGLQFIKRRIKNERELQTIDTVVSAEVQSYRQRKREEKAEEHKKEVKKKKNKVGRNKGMLDAMLEETAKEETKKVETTLEKNKKRKRDVEKEEQKKKLREMLGGDEQD
jgi:U3 small nucleolar RNA-associated protein 12